MSEPNAVAETVEEVVAGVWRWHVWDDRIDFESDAHAVSDEGGTVLIDPLPLQENALKKLAPIIAICLTNDQPGDIAGRTACSSTRRRAAGRWTRSPTSGIAKARCCRAASKPFTLLGRNKSTTPSGASDRRQCWVDVWPAAGCNRPRP